MDKFSDYYLLEEAASDKRIALLASQYGAKWNDWKKTVALRCIFFELEDINENNDLRNAINAHFGYGSETNFSDLIPRNSRSHREPDFQKTSKFRKRIRELYDVVEKFVYDEFKMISDQEDEAWMNVGRETYYGEEYKHDVMVAERLLSFGGSEDNLETIQKHIKEIDEIADPSEKGDYIEWIFLSLIEGDWDDELSRDPSEFMQAFEDGMGNWEDLVNIRELLRKYDRLVKKYKSQIIQTHNTVLNYQDGNNENMFLKEILPKNPLNILDFKRKSVEIETSLPFNPGSYISTPPRTKALIEFIEEVEKLHPEVQRGSMFMDDEGTPVDYKTIDGAEFINEDENHIVYSLKDPDTVKDLCKDMGWCVIQPLTFTRYVKEGPMFLFYQKNSEGLPQKAKYLIHTASKQAKAKNNTKMSSSQVDEIYELAMTVPDIKEYLETLTNVKNLISPTDQEEFYTYYEQVNLLQALMSQGKMDEILEVTGILDEIEKVKMDIATMNLGDLAMANVDGYLSLLEASADAKHLNTYYKHLLAISRTSHTLNNKDSIKNYIETRVTSNVDKKIVAAKMISDPFFVYVNVFGTDGFSNVFPGTGIELISTRGLINKNSQLYSTDGSLIDFVNMIKNPTAHQLTAMGRTLQDAGAFNQQDFNTWITKKESEGGDNPVSAMIKKFEYFSNHPNVRFVEETYDQNFALPYIKKMLDGTPANLDAFKQTTYYTEITGSTTGRVASVYWGLHLAGALDKMYKELLASKSLDRYVQVFNGVDINNSNEG